MTKPNPWRLLDRGVYGMAAKNIETGQIVTGDIINDLLTGGPVKRLAHLLGLAKAEHARDPTWVPGETFRAHLARARRRAVLLPRQLRRRL
jgi:hypothetical protein